MTPGEQRQQLESFARRSVAADDPLLHARLYAALIDLRLDSLLLALPADDLEMFLRSNGSLPPSRQAMEQEVRRGCWEGEGASKERKGAMGSLMVGQGEGSQPK